MRCFICDRILNEDQVHYNEEHEDFDPCPTCQQVIDDLLAAYGDQASIAEDEFSDPIFDDLYPLAYDPFEVEDFT